MPESQEPQQSCSSNQSASCNILFIDILSSVVHAIILLLSSHTDRHNLADCYRTMQGPVTAQYDTACVKSNAPEVDEAACDMKQPSASVVFGTFEKQCRSAVSLPDVSHSDCALLPAFDTRCTTNDRPAHRTTRTTLLEILLLGA